MASKSTSPPPLLLKSRTFSQRGFQFREHQKLIRFQIYREDIADWLSALFPQATISADTLLKDIEDGTLLCRLANLITPRIGEWLYPLRVAPANVKQLKHKGVQRGTTIGINQARDNAAQFIQWTRDVGIRDACLFEALDLIEGRNENNILNCLMEIARGARGFLDVLPQLIRFEREMDGEDDMLDKSCIPDQNEILDAFSQTSSNATSSADLLQQGTAQQQQKPREPKRVELVPLGDGQYQMGEKVLHCRVFKTHIVVRVGGGWEGLKEYLSSHEGRDIELVVANMHAAAERQNQPKTKKVNDSVVREEASSPPKSSKHSNNAKDDTRVDMSSVNLTVVDKSRSRSPDGKPLQTASKSRSDPSLVSGHGSAVTTPLTKSKSVGKGVATAVSGKSFSREGPESSRESSARNGATAGTSHQPDNNQSSLKPKSRQSLLPRRRKESAAEQPGQAATGSVGRRHSSTQVDRARPSATPRQRSRLSTVSAATAPRSFIASESSATMSSSSRSEKINNTSVKPSSTSGAAYPSGTKSPTISTSATSAASSSKKSPSLRRNRSDKASDKAQSSTSPSEGKRSPITSGLRRLFSRPSRSEKDKDNDKNKGTSDTSPDVVQGTTSASKRDKTAAKMRETRSATVGASPRSQRRSKDDQSGATAKSKKLSASSDDSSLPSYMRPTSASARRMSAVSERRQSVAASKEQEQRRRVDSASMSRNAAPRASMTPKDAQNRTVNQQTSPRMQQRAQTVSSPSRKTASRLTPTKSSFV